MNNGINVLSLFDGISCGRIALERANIKINNYFASEIDKSPIMVSCDNYPDIIQLGSVTDIITSELPDINLLIGGSPCQSFSTAGKQEGFDGKSGLFFEWLRCFQELKPKFFLLENVIMKKEWENTISDYIGVKPIMINSSTVSAQSRKRLYWTNIPIEYLPNNKMYSNSIIGEEYLTKSEIAQLDFSKLDFGGFKSLNSQKRIINNFRGKDQLINCLTASNTSNPAGCGCSNFVYYQNGEYKWRKITREECEQAQTIPINYTKIIADTPAKKVIGNGWTVDVISHIFNFLPKAYKNDT